PVTSFESVIDMRLRETFEIIREQLVSAKVQLPPGVNVIATGGGSLYYRTREIIGEVFGTHCQVRRPADLLGASTGLNNPRYSAVWGALKFAAESLRQSGQSADNPLDMLVNGLNRLFDNSRIGLKNFGKSIKF
ncbi:MAG: hypothetical protein J6Q80_03405, partial [Lentisphaeria bacterium]|nr:hypothetical protein [Lentisphaeria bacterium]